MAVTSSTLILKKELQNLNKNPVEGFSVGLENENDLFNWRIMIVGPNDTLYEGGFFQARMRFPNDYPDSPPQLTFITPIFHPNIYSDGRVCISILHPPVNDEMSGELASERWTPIQNAKSVLLSVISLLSSPNPDSPANVDAAHLWRTDKSGFKKKVRECVERSLQSF